MSLIGSRSKITIPSRRREWLSRGRLLNLLQRLVNKKLVLVAAPPGYGKTALLVDFASQAEMPVCWLGLDALDEDPRRFLAQFIASITQQFPDFGQESLAAVISDPLSPIRREVVTMILANEVSARIGQHFVIIIDDFQHLETREETLAVLNAFIDRVGENCHLVLASRTLPSLPCIPGLAASMQVGGISFEELSFQPDEIQALLLLNNGVHIPFAEAEELALESEGWITGLILSFQTNPVGGADQLRLARVSGVGLYDYLAQQVLAIQPADIRDFLLRSSFLEEFDAALCAAVFGSETDWAELIRRTVRANLFILAVGPDSTWHRYNPLFRQFLQETLARERPGERSALLNEIGRVYRSRQEWEKAFGIYQQLADADKLADLILEASPSLARDGHLITLSSWISGLPQEMNRDRPALASLRGIVCVMLGEVEVGLDSLNHAVVSHRMEEDNAGLALSLSRRTFGRIFRGDYRGALKDAEEACELAEALPDLLPVRADALRSKGLSLLNLDRTPEAGVSLAEALQLYTALKDTNKAAVTHIDLGYASSTQGRFSEALRHYKLALAHWEDKKNLIHQATLLNNIGVLLHAKGELLAACRQFEEGLAKARRSGYRRAESLTLASLGDIFADLEDYGSAANAYQEARVIAAESDMHSLLVYLDLADALVASRQGDDYLAFELLAIVKAKIQRSSSDYERGLFSFRAGQIDLAENSRDALEALSRSVDYFQQGGRKAELAQANLLAAEACHRIGDQDGARTFLERALTSASALENDYCLVSAGRFSRGVLEAAAGDHGVGGGISRLLDRLDKFEARIGIIRRTLRGQGSPILVSPPQLSIKSLGSVVVMLGDKKLATSDWHSIAARDMFFCLLAHPDGLAKEQIGAIFWPDSSEQKLRTNFKNTIYRLRLTMGSDVITFENGRYSFNSDLDYWYDAKEFLAILAENDPAEGPGVRIARLQSAIALYDGDYLPGVDHAWVVIERERLRQSFFSAAMNLGMLNLDIHDFEAALDPALHLLMMDPCFEGAHRLIMRAHAGMGNRSAVIRQFNRCREALWQEYQTLPSEKTISLYEELTGHSIPQA